MKLSSPALIRIEPRGRAEKKKQKKTKQKQKKKFVAMETYRPHLFQTSCTADRP